MPSTDVIRAECQVGLARFVASNPAPENWFDFWCSAWFAAVDVMEAPPRELALVESELALLRALNPPRPARRRPNYGGSR